MGKPLYETTARFRTVRDRTREQGRFTKGKLYPCKLMVGLTETQKIYLETYCEIRGITQSEGVRRALTLLFGE